MPIPDVTNSLLVNLIELAYEIKNEQEFQTRLKLCSINNWELLHRSNGNLAECQYKTVDFINKPCKKIIIASAGTHLTDIYDLQDNLRLVFNYPPSKMHSIKTFLNNIQNKVTNINEYDLHFTGHSLGSIFAELSALEALSRGLKTSGATTFENPGSKLILEGAIKNKSFSGKQQIDLSNTEFTTYQTLPNPINHLKPPTTKHINLVLLDKEETNIVIEKIKQDNIFSYLTKIVNTTVSPIYNLFGLVPKTQKIFKQHSIHTFQKHFAKEKSEEQELKVYGWNQNKGLPIIDYNDKLAMKIKESYSLEKNLVMYEQLERDDYVIINPIKFNYEDLQGHTTSEYDTTYG